MQSLLLLDAIIVFKFLLIFVFKKATLVMEDFWVTFLNIYFVGFGFIAQGILVFFQTGAKHLNFYICSGPDPAVDGEAALKSRHLLFSLYFVTAFLYIAIPIKIKLYKYKLAKEESNDNNVSSSSTALDKDFFIDTAVQFSVFVLFAINIVLSMQMSKLSPFEIDQFNNTLLIYIFNVAFPPLIPFILCFTHYCTRKDLRDAVIKALVNAIFVHNNNA